MVNAFRYGFLGTSDVNVYVAFAHHAGVGGGAVRGGAVLHEPRHRDARISLLESLPLGLGARVGRRLVARLRCRAAPWLPAPCPAWPVRRPMSASVAATAVVSARPQPVSSKRTAAAASARRRLAIVEFIMVDLRIPASLNTPFCARKLSTSSHCGGQSLWPQSCRCNVARGDAAVQRVGVRDRKSAVLSAMQDQHRTRILREDGARIELVDHQPARYALARAPCSPMLVNVDSSTSAASGRRAASCATAPPPSERP